MKCEIVPQIAPQVTSLRAPEIAPHVAPRPRAARIFLRWPITLVDGILLWLERYRQRRHLQGLNEHMLKDLGLSRADVEQECRKHPWQN